MVDNSADEGVTSVIARYVTPAIFTYHFVGLVVMCRNTKYAIFSVDFEGQER